MKVVHCITVLALSAGAASGAGAQAFFGASVGQARVNLDCAGAASCDRSDTAYKLFGGYMFTPRFGVEGGYHDQGRQRLTGSDGELGAVGLDWRSRAVSAFGVAAYPVEQASFFAKLGLATTRVKVRATSSVLGAADDTESHTAAAWGLGVAYQLGRSLGARVEYEQLRMRFMDEKPHAKIVTLGLQYRF